MLTSINKASKMDSIFGDIDEAFSFSGFSQRKNLESSAIGEYRLVIILELMCSSKMFYYFISGSQVEMIGIIEYNLGSHLI
jgi:hypothetical protein